MKQPDEPTLINLFRYLWSMIRWRFSKKLYTGRMVRYKGKRRKIIGETYRHFVIDRVNKQFSKDDYPVLELDLFYSSRKYKIHNL